MKDQFHRILLSERVPFTCISNWGCKFIIIKICRRIILFILDLNLLLIPLKISVIFFLGPEQHHCHSSLPDWKRSENMEFQLKGFFLETILVLFLFVLIFAKFNQNCFYQILNFQLSWLLVFCFDVVFDFLCTQVLLICTFPLLGNVQICLK